MPLFNTGATTSSVFAEGALDSTRHLKPLNPLREAFIINELAHLPKKILKEFVSSPEAKMMLEEEIISYDSLTRLAGRDYNDRAEQLVVCHMAREEGDELWDELVRHREEERRIMNELISKYGTEAKPYVSNYRENYVNKYVPKGFRTGE